MSEPKHLPPKPASTPASSKKEGGGSAPMSMTASLLGDKRRGTLAEQLPLIQTEQKQAGPAEDSFNVAVAGVASVAARLRGAGADVAQTEVTLSALTGSLSFVDRTFNSLKRSLAGADLTKAEDRVRKAYAEARSAIVAVAIDVRSGAASASAKASFESAAKAARERSEKLPVSGDAPKTAPADKAAPAKAEPMYRNLHAGKITVENVGKNGPSYSVKFDALYGEAHQLEAIVLPGFMGFESRARTMEIVREALGRCAWKGQVAPAELEGLITRVTDVIMSQVPRTKGSSEEDRNGHQGSR